MALKDNILDIGNAAMQTSMVALALHTAQPDTNGSNPAASARKDITHNVRGAGTGWDTAANGDMVITEDLAFTGGAANGPCTHVGFWSQVAAGGTFYGWLVLTGDQTFNAAGEYTVTAVTITGTAT